MMSGLNAAVTAMDACMHTMHGVTVELEGTVRNEHQKRRARFALEILQLNNMAKEILVKDNMKDEFL